MPVAISGEITFSALESGWRRHASVSADASGRATDAFRLPPLGQIVVTFRDRDRKFHPLVTQVRP